MSLFKNSKKKVLFLYSYDCIVNQNENGIEAMDQDDSVDDPVEDAALLDDSCEIKRDSICVLILLLSVTSSHLQVIQTLFFALHSIPKSLSSLRLAVRMIRLFYITLTTTRFKASV